MKVVEIFIIVILVGFAFAQVTIDYCDPDSCFQGSLGYSVQISGDGFVGADPITAVDFGEGISVETVEYISPILLRAIVDVDERATVGMRSVIVENPDGATDTLHDGFRVLSSDTVPPEVSLVFPMCGDTIACADSAIIFSIIDEHGFLPESLLIEINGIEYRYPSPELSIIDDTVVVFRPVFPFPEMVHVRFLNVSDSLGHSYAGREVPIDCYFWVDTLGPYATEPWPPPFGSTRSFQPLVKLRVLDDISGVDRSSIVVRVNGFEYHWGDASLSFRGDTLLWNARDASVTFADEDTVFFCLMNADDRTSICDGPNPLQGDSLCWFFRVIVPPPTHLDLRVHSVNERKFPYIKAKCEVLNEDEFTIDYLNESNFIVSEISDGLRRQYPIIVEDLGGGGIADIVFVIDDTGSMGGLIADVRDGVEAFAESLAVSDINYRLGLVTFKDEVSFGYGFDLIADVDEFISWIDAIRVGGGGDPPEVSMDAIYQACDSMNFRHGTQIIIIMVTDNVPHYRGDGTPFSDVVTSEVIDKLIEKEAVCFIVMESSYLPMDTNYIQIAEASGGAYYETADFEIILADVVEHVRGGYFISWTTSSPIADCKIRDVELYCAWPNIYDTSHPHFIFDYDTTDYHSPCSPSAMIVEPLPDKFTSQSRQRILMNFDELAGGIDSASIQLVVGRNLITPASPSMQYEPPNLQYLPEPEDSFVHGERVLVNLARVLNNQGHYPYHGPVVWSFIVDLLGPIADSPHPPDGAIAEGMRPVISFEVVDDHAGVDENSIVLAIESNQTRLLNPPMPIFIDLTTEGVEWEDPVFRVDTDAAGIRFEEFDSVCVTIVRALDKVDYGSPNPLQESGLVQWCFFIPEAFLPCPDFSDFQPPDGSVLDPGVPFHLSVTIEDTSEAHADYPDSYERGVSLLWSDDGVVFGSNSREVRMDSIGDGRFQSTLMIPGQSVLSDFVWVVWAFAGDPDDDNPDNRRGCFSEVQRLVFAKGPFAEVLMPIPLIDPDADMAVTTLPFQAIKILLIDDELPIDEASIELEINGEFYDIASPELHLAGDTVIFRPLEPWADGSINSFFLHSAGDTLGNPLENPLGGRFLVDYSGPYIPAHTIIPARGERVHSYRQMISLTLLDEHREVDPESIVFFAYGDTASIDETGLFYDTETHNLTYNPRERDITFTDGDTVCIEGVTALDIQADYGEPNPLVSDLFPWCFVISVTTCGHRPPIFTPNGDGFNDYVYFEYPNYETDPAEIKIFNSGGELVRELEIGLNIWDGYDGYNSPARAGLYIYSIRRDGDLLCSGTVTLIR